MTMLHHAPSEPVGFGTVDDLPSAPDITGIAAVFEYRHIDFDGATYTVAAAASRQDDRESARERLDAAVAEAEHRIATDEPYPDIVDREEFRRRYDV